MRKTLAILLTVLVLPGVSEAKLKKSMKKECLVCHENWLLETKVESPKLLSNRSLKAADKLMCLSCHDGSLADDRETFLGFGHFSHPVDKEVPKDFKLPKGFPTKDGKLYCGTCHTPHTETGSEKKLDYTFMRKPNVNSALCMECHKANAEHGMNHPILEDTADKLSDELIEKISLLGGRVTESGELQCESCHSPHKGKAKKALLKPVDRSQLCIVCHTDRLNSEEHKDYRNHPIHKDFPEEAEIALFEEKKAITKSVECMTCHKVHKEENKHLLVAKEEKLCSSCHVEEGKVSSTKHNIAGNSCKSCHTPHKAKGPKLWSREIPEDAYDYASIIEVKGKSDILCLSCHYTGNKIEGKEVVTVGTLTHPTGKSLKEKVNLPLPNKKLACVTCHDPHHAYDDGKESKFLRKERLSLCYTCHKSQTKVKEGAHGEIDKKRWKKGDCFACHNVHNAKDGYLSRVVYGEISPMEPAVDGFCLACHDPEGMAEHKVKESIYNEHPVGVKNPTNKLPGKKIACVTCHEPHSHEEELLRIPVKGDSALCLTCHTDKNLKGTSHDLLHNPEVKLSEEERKELLKGGACSACHTPHNPAYKVLWSRKLGKGRTINERMCNSCHSEGGLAADKTIGKHTHPFGREVTEKNLKMIKNSRLPLISQMTGHPAKRGESGVLDCATCHEPHNGADKKRLTRYTVEGDSSLCTACHTSEAAVVGTDHDMRVVGKKLKGGVCSACHVPHNAKNELLWAKEVKRVSGNRMSDYCLSCHTKGGLGESKVIKYYYHPSKDVKVKNLDRPGREGDWPLFTKDGKKVSVGGEIVCETCHNPHVWSKDGGAPHKPVEGNVLNSFLRNRTLKGSICVDCHGLDALYRYKFFHTKKVHQETPSYK
ncbi:cytochrome c3 family protein [Phorcysia thermohydrogeniphila]|uniref:Putative CXXCH cytochrome family protein n=1 Tax=Phorcysia thermohydrogeniphila TaxID=936138 RepID=A0A4R1GDR5_9BACT|nr:cytochrome c3 family protein [Phorcysia thermohydrogeniphila]TCK06244.1 putative CXXCH cytochrome family protein [Phorcysia thermohydrogeniphila]